MDVDLGVLKSLFTLESFYGMCTASVKHYKQCKYKITYSVLLVMTQLIEHVVFWYFETIGSGWARSVVVLITLLSVWSVINSISDYKTKISSALSVEAAETILCTEDLSTPTKTRYKRAIVAFIALLVLNHFITQVYQYLWGRKNFEVTKYIVTFHNQGVIWTQAFTMFLLLMKIKFIKTIVTTSLIDVTQNQSVFMHSKNRWAKRVNSVQRESLRKIKLLTEIQGSLHRVETDLQDSLWIIIVLYRLLTEISAPVYVSIVVLDLATNGIIIWVFSGPMVFAIAILGLIYASEDIIKNTQDAQQSLVSAILSWKTESGRKVFRHQLLANIHRSSPFSCRIFDLEYSLVADIMDNALLTTVTVLGK